MLFRCIQVIKSDRIMASHPPKVCVLIYLCSKNSKNFGLYELWKPKWAQGALQQSSQLSSFGCCFIEVDSQIIPGWSSITERIWDRSTAASSCHYDSCPMMLPRARKSKHNWPFWSLRVRLTWSCLCCATWSHSLVLLLLFSKIYSGFSLLLFLFVWLFFNTHKFNKNSVFQGLVCRPISSWQSCSRDSCRKLHICWGFHVNCQQNMNVFFLLLFNEKQENEWILEMAIHTFFIKTWEEGHVRTLLMLNHPLNGRSRCINSFLCLHAHSRTLRWHGTRSSNEEATKSAGLRDAHTMTMLFPSGHLLELLLPRCFTS